MFRKNSIERIIRQLNSETTIAVHALAYLDATVDDETAASKLGETEFYRVHYIQTLAVAQLLASYCARAWDRTGFQLVISELQRNKAAIVAHVTQPEQTQDSRLRKEALDRFEQNFDDVNALGLTDRLKLFRDEHLAHVLEGKSDLRTRNAERAALLEDFTFNHVQEIGNRTISMLSDIAYAILDDKRNRVEELARAKDYYSNFWMKFPDPNLWQ